MTRTPVIKSQEAEAGSQFNATAKSYAPWDLLRRSACGSSRKNIISQRSLRTQSTLPRLPAPVLRPAATWDAVSSSGKESDHAPQVPTVSQLAGQSSMDEGVIVFTALREYLAAGTEISLLALIYQSPPSLGRCFLRCVRFRWCSFRVERLVLPISSCSDLALCMGLAMGCILRLRPAPLMTRPSPPFLTSDRPVYA